MEAVFTFEVGAAGVWVDERAVRFGEPNSTEVRVFRFGESGAGNVPVAGLAGVEARVAGAFVVAVEVDNEVGGV